MLNIKSGIYKIVNLVNGKVYVGSAKNLKSREQVHFSTLKSKSHFNPYLQNSYNKYGKEKFIFTTIEYINNCDFLVGRENYWIKFLKSNQKGYGYNIRKYASSNLGIIMSEEGRKNISIAAIGRKASLEARQHMRESHANISSETIQKMSDATSGEKNPMYGKNHTPETRQKMINNHADQSGEKSVWFGRHHSEESKLKQSSARIGKYTGKDNPNYGNYWSDEQKQKQSENNTGYKHTLEARKKMSLTRKGKPHSEEHKKNLLLSLRSDKNPLRGTHLSEERKLRISKSSVGKKRGLRINSKYVGVRKATHGNKFSARITCMGKSIHLGTFLTEEDAAIAYNLKARELHGIDYDINLINKKEDA